MQKNMYTLIINEFSSKGSLALKGTIYRAGFITMQVYVVAAMYAPYCRPS